MTRNERMEVNKIHQTFYSFQATYFVTAYLTAHLSNAQQCYSSPEWYGLGQLSNNEWMYM